MKKILDVGCGNRKIKNAVGIDMNPNTQADVIHNLEKFPWPFKSNTFDEIYCRDILEHLSNLVKTMEEIHRIGKPGAIVYITVPYYASKVPFLDPTHVRGFTEHSFDYFSEKQQFSHFNYISNARFEILEKKFLTYGKRRFIPFKSILRHFLLNMVDVLSFKLKIIK